MFNTDLIIHPLAQTKRWLSEAKESVRIIGLSGTALSFSFSQLVRDLHRPCLVVLAHRTEADNFYRELEFFLSQYPSENGLLDSRLHLYPPYDISPFTGISPHVETTAQRVGSLYTLATETDSVVVTCVEALLTKTLPKKTLLGALEYLLTGEEVEREKFIRRLEATGYQRTSLVEQRGDYAVRGAVIDLFPPLYSVPLRLEFWGDQIESIRQFDPLSQRTQRHLEEAWILPVHEIVLQESSIKRARSMGRLPAWGEELGRFPGQEAWLNHFYDPLGTLLEYLPSQGLLTLITPSKIRSEAENFRRKFDAELKNLRKEAAEKGQPFPEVDGLLMSLQELEKNFEDYLKLEFQELDLGDPAPGSRAVHIEEKIQLRDDLVLQTQVAGTVSLAPLAEKISQWIESAARVVVVSRTEQQGARIRDILENYQVPTRSTLKRWGDLPRDPGLYICLGRLKKGFAWPELRLYVVSEDEIFGRKKARARSKRGPTYDALKWSGLSQLKQGDLVVHEEHGIGRYWGLCTMEVEQYSNEFVVIEYANQDKLYIPADRISVLQKYLGADERSPKLDRLGGRSWNIAKKKAKKSIKEIAKQLVDLYALRRYRKGYAFSVPDNYFREFEATFEYEETLDQNKAIEEVLEDMCSDRPMDRLICGDVGFGKTEVAIRAAFKCIADGKQVAILVPTTVLAEQHYETFRQRMAPYSIQVGILSRFKTKKEQSEILKGVRSGRVQILIGTHRILQKDVIFSDLGLLIIDEEQRFGVKQKETIKKYRALIDVLAITATPIPRTLQLSMMGVRDLSIIETPPEDRMAIETHISPYDDDTISRAIEVELRRGGQVFFVHNKVQTIDWMAERLRKLVPGARFGIAHGQMRERDLENTMIHFLKRKIDVLVCSTIIESGLDIPSANTIIVNEVEKLGLAQIYQLRGRVGRAREKAYAYLLVSDPGQMTRDAERRLKALMEFTHLGAGIRIAMHDLRIRGGGNILGFVQSGHIQSLGYELYLRMIEQAIAELKGEEWHEEINPEIHADLPAFLPKDYVADTDLRLNIYRRLSALRDESQLDVMVEEIHDRFGPPPKEAQNLIELMSIRLLLKRIGITRLDLQPSGLTLTFGPHNGADSEKLVRLVSSNPGRYHFLSENRLKIRQNRVDLPHGLQEIKEAIRALE